MRRPPSSASRSAVRVRAHAKINLNLRVLAARPDGYHDVRTVFQAIALHDTLTLLSCPGRFTLESSVPGVPLDSTNLIWRAADLLWNHLGRDGAVRDVTIRLDKRIPMKAGLGGGSADAAAALLGLSRLWKTQVPLAQLVELGKQLGADVPFFFTGGAALGLGRGDEISALPDLAPLAVLLVMPGFDVVTADAYRWVDEARFGQVGQVGHRLSAPERRAIPGCAWPPPDCDAGNDFEPVVAARHPDIERIIGMLEANGARMAAMSGSGSAVFGLFDRDDRLPTAAAAVARAGHSVEHTRTLTRAEYRHAGSPVACRPEPARR